MTTNTATETGLSRRTLLRAAVAAPLVAAVPVIAAAPAEAATNPYKWLHQLWQGCHANGSVYNDSIMLLQLRLGQVGHRVAVDGKYGPATAAAVLAYQKARGLKRDGVAGPQTLHSLGMSVVRLESGLTKNGYVFGLFNNSYRKTTTVGVRALVNLTYWRR